MSSGVCCISSPSAAPHGMGVELGFSACAGSRLAEEGRHFGTFGVPRGLGGELPECPKYKCNSLKHSKASKQIYIQSIRHICLWWERLGVALYIPVYNYVFDFGLNVISNTVTNQACLERSVSYIGLLAALVISQQMCVVTVVVALLKSEVFFPDPKYRKGSIRMNTALTQSPARIWHAPPVLTPQGNPTSTVI